MELPEDMPCEKKTLNELETKLFINEILQRVPLEQREVVLLRIREEMKFQEIADIQGCSLSTVKSRYRLGSERLRKELADEEKTQEAASGSASRDKAGEAAADAAGEKAGTEGTGMADGAELESEFAEIDPEGTGETVILDGTEEASSADAVSEQMDLSFSPETDQLLWPVAGNVIMDYSMDKTVYFATLDQYKYNPAVIIQGTLDENVMSAAPGQVTKIETLEETGMTVTMDIGDGYELVYGQLKELPVKEGDYLKAGETVGYVSEPTRYYTKEGCNVYFEVRKDGESVDPMSLLQ